MSTNTVSETQLKRVPRKRSRKENQDVKPSNCGSTHVEIHGIENCASCGKYRCEFDKKEVNLSHAKKKSLKQFSCEICSKSFTSKQSMQEHVYIHTGERPYQCEVCGKSFTQRGNMNAHKRMHDPKYDPYALKYQCDKCGKGYGIGQRASFDEHVAKHRGEVKRHTCHICGKVIISSECYKTHMRAHSGEKPFSCDVCRKAFSAKKYLISHRRIHTGEKPYNCDLCNKSFSQKGTLNSHRRNHLAGKVFVCESCDKSFSLKSRLVEHKKSHKVASPLFFISPEGLKLVSIKVEEKNVKSTAKGQEPGVCENYENHSGTKENNHCGSGKESDVTSKIHKTTKPRLPAGKGKSGDGSLLCNICHEKFAESVYLKKHKLESHPSSFVCQICKKGYISKYHLNQHTSKVHPSNAVALKCHLCDYKTHNRFNFKGHIDRHNKATSFICDVCGKGCYSKGTLEEHKQGKHGSGFPCEICGAALTSVSNLRQHKKTHEPKAADVKFQCDVCGKGFRARSKCAFRLHVLRHQGIVKEFKCFHCEKVLTSNNSYRQHMRKHSGEKPFICEFCSKAFSEKKYLHVHRRIHTGEKPYECDICGTCFNQRSTMTSHRRSHGKS